MEPILTIDIGAGTTDVLVFFPDSKEHYKAVAVSPIRKLAESIRQTNEDLLITGTIMGGGAVSLAVCTLAKSFQVYMTPEAAKTVNDDLDKVRSKGIVIISENEAEHLPKGKIRRLTFGDVSPSGIHSLMNELGVIGEFSYIAGALQDHGVSPEGVSSLDFRYLKMEELIGKSPFPESLLFPFEEIPDYFTRMKATAKLLSEIPHREGFMMDTGMAAILGASLDSRLKGCGHFLIIDIGNSHTLGACLSNGLIGGFFEYHTNNLNPERLRNLLLDLGNGTLTHRQIVADGGHGAYIRSCPGFHKIETIVVTGPRRRELMKGMDLEFIDGAPLGDNMMTGTAGLLEAINRRENLKLVL